MHRSSPVTPSIHLPPGGCCLLSPSGSLPALLSGLLPKGRITCIAGRCGAFDFIRRCVVFLTAAGDLTGADCQASSTSIQVADGHKCQVTSQ